MFWIYLIVLGLLCCGLAWYTTKPFGPGVGTDGAIQVSTADRLLRGEGFVDYAGDPFVRWPPLYPITLAALSLVSGVDTFSIAWYLNIALFGAIIWLGGWLLYACFQDAPLWAYAGSLILATSGSLLIICTTLGTDPLFTALALGWILVASRYLTTRSPAALFWMALLSCLGTLQRLPGVTLIGGGAIIILIANRQRIGQGLGTALPFAALTSIPLALWVVVYSYPQSKTLFGIPLFQATRPLINFKDSLRKIGHWFIPYNLVRYLPLLLLAASLALVYLALRRQMDWKRLGQRLAQPVVASSLLFVALYYAFLVLTINSIDTTYVYYDRYYLVMLVPLLMLFFALSQELLLARLSQPARLAALLLFAVWLVFPLYNLSKTVRASRLEGVPGYNKYNTREMRQSKIVSVLQSIKGQEGAHVYSNYPGAVWFYLRGEALPSPRGSIFTELNPDEVLEHYRGWPGDRPGYLVWFTPNEYNHVLDPAHLKKVAELEQIYNGEDGQVYRVLGK